MSSCECGDETGSLAGLHSRQRAILFIVFWINVVMFAVEFGAGIWADSNALKADSMDNLGDAFVYAFSLYVLHHSLRWRAGATLAKGFIQLAFGIGIIADSVHTVIAGAQPLAPVMAVVAALAFTANSICFILLMRHRGDDLNMRSVWLCSRNDLANNLGVLVAAGLVFITGSFWPDVLVGGLIAALFIHTSAEVLRDALFALRTGNEPAAR